MSDENRGGFKRATLERRPPISHGEVFGCPHCSDVHQAHGRHGTLFYICQGVTHVAGVAGRNVVGLRPDAE